MPYVAGKTVAHLFPARHDNVAGEIPPMLFWSDGLPCVRFDGNDFGAILDKAFKIVETRYNRDFQEVILIHVTEGSYSFLLAGE